MLKNKQIFLKETPQDKLSNAHFEIRTSEIPSPADGQILIETLYISIDAANRAWMQGRTYRDQILPVLQKFENFHWLGAIDYPDKVREFLTEIDVYALISGIDMSPLTLQEAQLMEKSVVATNVGGIPELMKDGETGFLVRKNNPEELTEKISILVNDNKKSQSMGKKGKDFVSTNFNWNKICRNFLDCLKKYDLNAKR